MTKSETSTSSNGFDWIASIYDRLAKLVFGQTLLRARQAYLSHILKGNRVLILGGGTGKILPTLLQQIGEEGKILYVEASEKMILRAVSRLDNHPQKDQVSFLCGTQQSIPHEYEFDRIISNFFLDLFDPEQLIKVFDLLHTFLLPEGKWLIADFSLPTTIWRFPAQVLIRSMYLFFRICCGIRGKSIQDFSHLFSSYAYVEVEKTTYWKGVIYSTVYQKKREIRY